MSMVPFRRAALFALASCFASAIQAQTLITASDTGAPTVAQAPVGDCGNIDFTQNTSLVPTAGNSVACAQPGTQYHADTSWWRAFDLGEHGVEGDFSVCSVEFAIELANDGDNLGQPLTINLYQNSEDCPFPGGTRTLVGTATINVTDQTLSNLTIPVTGTVDALKELVVELAVPNGIAAQDVFFPGGNSAGQSAPNYWSSTACSFPNPVDIADLGFPNLHLIMRVFGTQGPLGPKDFTVDTAGNGVIELGENVGLATAWKNLTATNQTLVGDISTPVAPPGYTLTFVDPNASFGLVAPGATDSCESAPADCYAVRIDGAGFGHRDVTITERIQQVAVAEGSATLRDRVLHVGQSFADVPTSHMFYRFIETLLHSKVTAGCATPNSYCPDTATPRKQMAVFLLKGLLGACYLPPPATGVFDDVPQADPFAPWIEDLFARAITSGCGGGPSPAPIFYCPDQPVKRKQMAVFLLKTLLGSGHTPPTPTNIFEDVPADGFQPFIEDLYNRGITGGCAGGPPPADIFYCPENPVTRGQMAVFLTLTFDLLLYLP